MRIVSRPRVLLVSLLLAAAQCPRVLRAEEAGAPPRGKSPQVVTVGITEYQALSSTYEKYESLFKELTSAEDGDEVVFRFAIGTYGEVRDWYDRRRIDVAVLSAMPVADLLGSAGGDELQLIKESYVGDLADVAYPNAPLQPNRLPVMDLFQDPVAETVRRQPDNLKYMYRTACLVHKDSKLQTLSQLKEMMGSEEGRSKVRFLFVRPYSVSGYILPLYFLQEKGINPLLSPAKLDFTYQHSKSLERLLNAGPEERDYTVAFVNDNVSYKIPDNSDGGQQFRLLADDLPTPPGGVKLESAFIPHEAVVVNHNLKETGNVKKFDDLKRLMTKLFARRNERLSAPSATGAGGAPAGSKFEPLRMQNADDWVKQYDEVMNWLQAAHLPRRVLYRSTFDDLLKDLDAYQHSPKNQENPLRLALVLSGGGAKCAYQAGAIEAIEKILAEHHAKGEYKDIDVNLVVGTSGGAINALVTALGLTREQEGRDKLLHTWQAFRQKDFFQPSLLFNILFGLFFVGLLQLLLVVAAVLLFGRERPHWRALLAALAALGALELLLVMCFRYPRAEPGGVLIWVALQTAAVLAVVGLIRLLRRAARGWWRLAGWIMVCLSCVEILLYVWPGPRQWPAGLGESHLFMHFWMVVTLYSIWSFPWPLLIGSAMILSSRAAGPEFDMTGRGVRLVAATSVLLAAVCFLLLVHVLRASAPASEKGIDKAFAEGIPGLLGVTPPAGGDAKQGLKDLSRQIVVGRPDLFKRDLVITNSRLPVDEREAGPDGDCANGCGGFIGANQLPEDLYFYFRRDTARGRPSDTRFISFRKNPEKLLDVVIGSSTIYPIFPSRELTDVRIGNEDRRDDELKVARQVRIIDGGFIHNSPIEAAQSWGATHIIQIDASPEWQPSAPSNFAQNAALAFNYLFAQAQRTDQLVKGGVEIFQLRPTSECEKLNLTPLCADSPQPDMDTFDFNDVLVAKAYVAGRSDVAGARPLFQRVPGEPVFRNIAQPPEPAGN